MSVCVYLCVWCRSKEPIQLNVWNTINLERSNRKGEIMVNKKDPVRGEAPVRNSRLTTACEWSSSRHDLWLQRSPLSSLKWFNFLLEAHLTPKSSAPLLFLRFLHNTSNLKIRHYLPASVRVRGRAPDVDGQFDSLSSFWKALWFHLK